VIVSSILVGGIYAGWHYTMDPPGSVPMVSPLPASAERESALAIAAAPGEAAGGEAELQSAAPRQQPDAPASTTPSAPGAGEAAGAADENPQRPVPMPTQRGSGGGPAQAAEAFPSAGQSLAALEPQMPVEAGGEPAGRTIHLDNVASLPEGTAPKVVLRADEDSWIQISERGTNRVLLARMLRTGDRVTVPGAAKLRLTVGNAGGIAVQVDGVAAPPLGPSGVVVRNISLDGARLLAGTSSSD
jgi:cytoskeleton protein RodZ